MNKSKPNQIINNKIGMFYGIDDKSYREWCKENGASITDKRNREKYIKEIIKNGYQK